MPCRLMIGSLLLLFGCTQSTVVARDSDLARSCPTGTEFGIFTVSEDGTSAEVEGAISDRSLDNFHCMLEQYPNIARLDLIEVPGSDVSVSEDSLTDTALELGRAVFDNDIDTHLVDGGWVASGGTDLLAAGRTISVGDDTEIGVHAWGGGWDGNHNGTASDIAYYPKHTHLEHEKYLQYYPDIGFDVEKGCQFYFFTIQVATVDDMHDMTDAEIERFFDDKAVPPTTAIRECPSS